MKTQRKKQNKKNNKQRGGKKGGGGGGGQRVRVRSAVENHCPTQTPTMFSAVFTTRQDVAIDCLALTCPIFDTTKDLCCSDVPTQTQHQH